VTHETAEVQPCIAAAIAKAVDGPGVTSVGSRLSGRPPVSASRPSPPLQHQQPGLGLRGLLLVVPIAVVLAMGLGGDGSTRVIGPFITYSLPFVAMVAFWWEDWPGTRLARNWSGWADTALIAIGGIVLTGVGQIIAGGLDVTGLFTMVPGPGHVPTFPATMPLAGAAFVAMLQLTLVGEGWPLRRLPRLPAGLLALAIAWAIALVVALTVAQVMPPAGSRVTARHGPVPGSAFGTMLVPIGAWQVLGFVVWRGWPFSLITKRVWRLTSAHVLVIGPGLLTYLVARKLGDARLAALAGCVIAGGLLVGMLFEDWLSSRAALLGWTLALAALLAVLLDAAAHALHITRADDWVEHASLNALSTSIILHVAIGRRWPFATHSL
jgi:hypothetical protein